MKKTIVFLLLIMLCPALLSCAGNTPTDPGGTADDSAAPDAPAELVLASGGESEYVILYSAKEEYGRSNATRLYREIREKIGVILEMKEDGEVPGEGEGESRKAILVGRTDREESTVLRKTLKAGEFIIKAEGNALYLIGRNEEATAAAVRYFTSNLVGETKGELKLAGGLEVRSGDVLTPSLEWEGSALSFTDGGYARMIGLSDGSAIVAYSSGNRICVRKSEDGKKWGEQIAVTPVFKSPDGKKTLTSSNANVFELKDGTLMAACRAHTAKGSSPFYSSIRFALSSDGGRTWSETKIVAENTYQGDKFTGFWEPHMIYLPDGRLGIYYASDCIGGSAKGYPFVSSMTYQNIILHLYDETTATFGDPIVASDGEKHNSRDGMPVLATLSDGSMAMVIESSHDRKNYPFVIRILFSEDGIRWSDPKTIYAPTITNHYAGAPYIVTLPDGRIAVSCQATQYSGTTAGEDNVHNSIMNVLISKNKVTYADRDTIGTADFEKVLVNPFTTTDFAVWPSMAFYRDKLYCFAQGGTVGADGKSASNGLYLRIGILK
ncbi:MAG: exo-alpha-sialidase [Clostridia bacterium]|nr:exo-alpha-sialidase [Clostridia bacterium]